MEELEYIKNERLKLQEDYFKSSKNIWSRWKFFRLWRVWGIYATWGNDRKRFKRGFVGGVIKCY